MERTLATDAVTQSYANWTDADYEAEADRLLIQLGQVIEGISTQQKQIERSQSRIDANFAEIEKRLAALRKA